MSLCDLWLNHADSAYGSLIQDKQLLLFSYNEKRTKKQHTVLVVPKANRIITYFYWK